MGSMLQNFFKKYRDDLSSSLILALTIFFFAPLSVFLVNIRNVTFSLWDVFPGYLVLTLLIFLVLSCLSIAMKRVKVSFFPLAFLILSYCTWVQGTYLDLKVGQLNGESIDWSALTPFIIRDTLIWVVLIAAGIILQKKIQRHIPFGAGLLAIAQILPLALGIVTDINVINTQKSLQEDSKGSVLEFSTKQNVVVLVLDTFQSTFFSQIIADHPEYQTAFKDFTFFVNAASGYPTTKAAVPFILTGEFNDNSMPFSKFMESTANQSLPNILKGNGIATQYYSFMPFAYLDAWNEVAGIYAGSSRTTILNGQYQISFSRYLPSAFKQSFLENYYSNAANYYHKDMADLYAQLDNVSAGNTETTFKFIHVSGTHEPPQLSESLQYDRNAVRSPMDQALASLKVAKKLLDQMKARGVYNNSLIIIVADHGTPKGLLENIKETDTFDVYDPRTVMESSMPLLLVKDFSVKNEKMNISTSPVSTGDIPITVARKLGIKAEFPGMSILEPITDDRERTFMYYVWTQEAWTQDTLPPIFQFTIKGPIDQTPSWSAVNNAIPLSQAATIDLQLGENLIRAELNPMTNPAYHGFTIYSPAEPDRFWASAPTSCIILKTPQLDRGVKLQLAAHPFLTNELKEQKIEIYVDQKGIGDFLNGTNMSLDIPAQMAKSISSDNRIQLCFKFPNATSPQKLGLSDDPRKLGYWFNSIIFADIVP